MGIKGIIGSLNPQKKKKKQNHIDESWFQLSFISLKLMDSFFLFAETSDRTWPTHGFFPATLNLATNAIISANATCGVGRPEKYCKLVEHVFMTEPQCSTCDAEHVDTSKRHPISNAIDGTDSWWQSPSLEHGRRYEWVTITVDLKQVYQVAYVILKAANSPRPANWILEGSIDGRSYMPWQYYAIKDDECLRAYGVPHKPGKPKYNNDNEVICTSYYSKLNPLEGGEIHTSLVVGRPGAKMRSRAIEYMLEQEFTRARYVRLRFQKIRTLNADLMFIRSDDNPLPTVNQRYFYSVKDISIGGACACYGHARDCPIDKKTSMYKCNCLHNTCGANCNRCCPLYNQKKWEAGTLNDGAMCEKCECHGHAKSCKYDKNVEARKLSINTLGEYNGGGVCINCLDNTMGNNCEHCKDGYYRPISVSIESKRPCRKCDCRFFKGSTGQCVKDDSRMHEGMVTKFFQEPGSCICKNNFAGKKCQRCAPGFKNYPFCTPCPCHHAGTRNWSCDLKDCTCKENVEGSRCDKCKAGSYYLNPDNVEGCSKCFCFGVTNKCTSSELSAVTVKQIRGWTVTDLSGDTKVESTLEEGTSRIADDDMLGTEMYYWQAPNDYLGKKIQSYGGNLRFVMGYAKDRGDTSGVFIHDTNVILEGRGMRIGYAGGNFKPGTDNTYIVPLWKHGWYTLNEKGHKIKAVTKAEMMAILYSVDRILIRSKFHTDQIEGILNEVTVDVGSKYAFSKKKMNLVEKCECPPGYSGLSCENCLHGYRKVNRTLFGGECVKCNCNQHAERCDPNTGACINCLHYTTGPQCERCEYGYYGDATRGKPDDCKPCACPSKDPNNFSDTCTAAFSPTGDVIDYTCSNCEIGYMGDKCQRCIDGFFGNPLAPGNFCQPCDCNNNTDPGDIGICDTSSGECLKCIGNTDGWSLGPIFQLATCNPYGSISAKCDQKTGKCTCRPNFVGDKCDRCAEGFGSMAEGCRPCNCNPVGSLSKSCNPQSGICECKPGVFGTKCDSCLDGYYGFSAQGCQWCGCDPDGANTTYNCDEISGQCVCKDLVVGRACDRCTVGYLVLITGYWGSRSDQGCKPCNCNETGSVSRQCDDSSGKCQCKPGVGGIKCDQCLPGYFGWSFRGCRKCDRCDQPGRLCHPKTGECVCPPNTRGDRCQYCVPRTYGYDRLRGCKPCDCHLQGSVGEGCDAQTGKCKCLAGVEGEKCDQCQYGYYNFPRCRPCNCNIEGTLLSECRSEQLCQCDDRGQCPCKIHTTSRDCGQCKSLTFGLTKKYESGCYDCFCYGKSLSCSQGAFKWRQVGIITLTAGREANFDRTRARTTFSVTNGLKIIPEQTGNIRVEISSILDGPLYWSLPKTFLGDRSLSYNGVLKFKVTSYGRRRFPENSLSKFSLVQIQGNWRLILEYFAEVKSDGYYVVRLRESVSLQVAERQSVFPAASNLAVGVEVCQCPQQYVGASCQDPAEGYYRKRKDDFLNSKDILDLVGVAVPCDCNGRSKSCDKETGICYNCHANTTGSHCELCSTGFYGNPDVRPCRPCACPLLSNSFSDTCVQDGNDYYCTNCQPGYTGRYCHKCADGYYGDPGVPGGRCTPCACDQQGSTSAICDHRVGQCVCKEGITGRDCTICKPRYVITKTGCKSCDDDCTGLLLNDIDYFMSILNNTHITGLIPAPWHKLWEYENRTRVFRTYLQDYEDALRRGQQLIKNFNFDFDLESLANLLLLNAKEATIKAPKVTARAERVYEDALSFLEEMKNLIRYILDVINDLNMYGIESSDPSVSISRALEEAERILREIQSRKFDPNRDAALRELRKAKSLLERMKKLMFDRNKLDILKEKLSNLRRLIQDLVYQLSENVKKPTQESLKILRENQRVIAKSKEFYDQAKNISDITNAVLKTGEELIQEADALLREAKRNFQVLPGLLKTLITSTRKVRKQTSMLSRLNPIYRKRYVIPAQKHAADLMRQAAMLAKLFKATQDVSEYPLKAAKVYRTIVDALSDALAAARNASAAAETAHDKAFPAFGDSLVNRASRLKARSRQLLEAAKKLRDKEVPDLQYMLSEQIGLLDMTERSVRSGKRDLAYINRALDGLPSGLRDSLMNTIYDVTISGETADEANNQTDEIVAKISSELIPKFRLIQSGSAADLGNISQIIDQAQADIKSAVKEADNLKNHRKKMKNLGDGIHLNLDALRNKILQARQTASTIRVSLTADSNNKCMRTYRPEMEPSTANKIVVIYGISSSEQDSLLFYVGSKEKDDFMALEMVNRKIRFSWNTGGKLTGTLQHNLTLQTNDVAYSANSKWYKIEVNRYGNIATLSVQPSPQGALTDPNMVSGASAVGYSIIDLDSKSLFLIGGVPTGVNLPPEVKTKSYSGCMYELKIDGRQVGLWNFKSTDGCSGCKEGAAEEADLSSLNFKGMGYLSMPQISDYNAQSYSIALHFKTFDENALLFFSPNVKTGEYVSIELRDGKILYRFKIGKSTNLVLSTKQKYNTGTWTKVIAERSGLQGLLSVQNELLEGKVRSGVASSLDLKGSRLYFGGVPPTFSKINENWKAVSFTSFLGCMKGLQMDTTPLGVLRGQSYDVDPGCKQEVIRSVGFKGKGFIEVDSHKLDKRSSFGFTFSTDQSDALLLLSTYVGLKTSATQLKNYYSVSLVNGKLEARFDGGSGQNTLKVENVVNDNTYHLVSFIKTGNRVQMRLDDEPMGTIQLNSEIINAPASGGLYFGGVPQELIADKMVASDIHFKGTIKDAIFNNKIIAFNLPKRFINIGIGRPEITEMKKILVIETSAIEKCADRMKYTWEPLALSFGDTLDSKIQKIVNKKQISTTFTINFDFRTYYPNGMLLLLRNAKRKVFLMIHLLGGKVVVDYKGKTARQLQSQGGLNDGQWHSIKLVKSAQKLELSVDPDGEVMKTRVRKRLYLQPTFYVASFPEYFIQETKSVVTETFKGCIRNFKLNDKFLDLASGKVTNVGQCFSKIEAGSYFGGDAYAIFSKSFEVGLQTQVELEFKTAKLNGIILSVSEPFGSPSLAVELNNGNVSVNVNQGYGMKTFKAIQSFASKYFICDSKWHSVKVEFSKNSVSLRVDKETEQFGFSDVVGNKITTKSPLYIGGIPDYESKGALGVRDNFVGCIKNLAINQRRVDWIDMAGLNNVLPNSCPVN
ncbi:Laminin subunit alpha-2 [Nymphon striatum]|nr:Laminin subunit alpha-2 [Nymphon striatum]